MKKLTISLLGLLLLNDFLFAQPRVEEDIAINTNVDISTRITKSTSLDTINTVLSDSSKLSIVDSIKTKVMDNHLENHHHDHSLHSHSEDYDVLCHHYDALHDSCKIDFDHFRYNSQACEDNPYLEEVESDTSFWLSISPFYSSFATRNINPYKTAGTGTKFLKDTTSILLYDTSATEKQWAMPIAFENLRVTSPFKWRRYRWHKGTDLDLVTGDSVFSVFDGVVRISKYDKNGFGYYVVVRHYNGLETVYGHLSKQYVCPGQPVKAGELIGKGGNTGRSTGSHLHFETRFRGVQFNPEYIFDFKNQTVKSQITIEPKFFNYLGGSTYTSYAKRSGSYYTIRSGDTLGSIAKRYHTYVSTLCRLNGIRSTTVLRIGRRLRVR